MLLSKTMKQISMVAITLGTLFTASSYASDEVHTLKIHKMNDDVKVMVSEGDNVQVIKIDKSELSDTDLDEKLSSLPEETRSKIKDLLADAKIMHHSGKFVYFDDGEDGKKIEKVIMLGDVNELDMPVAPVPPVPPHPAKPVKVMKFAFNTHGDNDHLFGALTAMLKEAKLTPEQIDELQTLLNQK